MSNWHTFLDPHGVHAVVKTVVCYLLVLVVVVLQPAKKFFRMQFGTRKLEN